MKILLDPLIYWFADDADKEMNLKYWDKVTSIVEKYFDIRYVSSKYFIQLLQRLNKEPFKLSKEENSMKQKIIKRLLLNLDYPNNIDNIDCTNFIFPDNFETTDNDELNKYFSYIVNFLVAQNIHCLLFLSRTNHSVKINDRDNLFFIKHISGQIDSKITEILRGNEYLKPNLPIPQLHNPIPFSELCDYFFELQKEMKKKDDPMSVFWRVTKEVALRNKYTFDDIVTNKNTSEKHKRKIYTYNKKHYISADFETGCFELCDHRGKHQKEISYTGKELSPRDKSGGHDILV